MSGIKSGFVYLATNESMEGLVKIGMTFKPVSERIEELSAETGVPTPFVCSFYRKVDNPLAVENRLQGLFKYCRVNSKKEFFAIDWRAVMITLLVLVEKSSEEKQSLITEETVEIIQKEVRKALVHPLDIPPPPDRAEQYKEYIRSTVAKSTTADNYHKALLSLDKRRTKTKIDKNIYDIESIQEAQKIKGRLSKGGDLYKFYRTFHTRAAIGKYIEFLQKEAKALESKKLITHKRSEPVTHRKDRVEQFKVFLRGRVSIAVVRIDCRALEHLGEVYIGKNIYDIKSVPEAQAIKDRLSKRKGGDLSKFDQTYNPKGSMSASMGQYIEFLKQESEE